MKKLFLHLKEKRKAVASYITILIVMGIGFSIILAFSTLIIGELRGGRALLFSTKALYASESALEDALLRLRPGQVAPPSLYSLSVDDSSATVSISALIGGTRTITSEGINNTQKKKVVVTTSLGITKGQFFFGAQVGNGGLVMGNNSEVDGNVFSNGNIVGASGATITGTGKVAQAGNSISNVTINEDAYAYSFSNCTIGGTIHYAPGGSVSSCGAGNGVVQDPGIVQPVNLPVSSSTIEAWKGDAALGGTIGALSIPNNATQTRGPLKINGNLTLGNGSTLVMTGTIWVTGNLIMGNNSIIRLDTNYDTLSGMIIFDGKVRINNNGQMLGSNASSSFLMAVSESSSLDPNNPAIDIYNSAGGAVFYTNNGLIRIHNAVTVYEATGYKLELDNTAKIDYQSGLADISFTSGPSGASSVTSWSEVQ